MGKIKVLYCMETIGWGGVEQRRLSLVRHLPQEYFEIKIICTKVVGGMKMVFAQNNVELIEVGEFKQPFEVAKHQKALKIIRKYQPHIIHGAVFEGNTMACIGGIRGRVPVTILEETSDPQNRSKKANWLLNIYTRFADKIIAISPSVASYLEETAKVKKRKIQLINNGVEIPRVVAEEEVLELKRRYNISAFDFVIGCVGRLQNEVKRFTDILEAIRLLNNPSIKFLLVGSGKDQQLINDAAVQAGLQNQLIEVGYQEDTSPYYNLMDIFCIASDNEGFGLVAAEAMFHQLPVVATAVGGLKDIVIEGETGFLVPSHRPDKIAKKLQVLIDDPEMRRSMGAKGLSRAQQEYSAEVYVGKVYQLYQELLMEKGII